MYDTHVRYSYTVGFLFFSFFLQFYTGLFKI